MCPQILLRTRGKKGQKAMTETPPICVRMERSSNATVQPAAGFGSDGSNDCITLDWAYKNHTLNWAVVMHASSAQEIRG